MGSKLTADRLKAVLHYDPLTGVFMWLAGQRKGLPAGTDKGGGYVQISIDGVLYNAARLAVFYMTGEWPADDVDHRDRTASNNRWDNLRDATHAQNMQNKSLDKRSKTGHTGVHFDAERGKYRAQINVAGKAVRLGRFDTAELAAAAYATAKADLHTFNPVVA